MSDFIFLDNGQVLPPAYFGGRSYYVPVWGNVPDRYLEISLNSSGNIRTPYGRGTIVGYRSLSPAALLPPDNFVPPVIPVLYPDDRIVIEGISLTAEVPHHMYMGEYIAYIPLTDEDKVFFRLVREPHMTPKGIKLHSINDPLEINGANWYASLYLARRPDVLSGQPDRLDYSEGILHPLVWDSTLKMVRNTA